MKYLEKRYSRPIQRYVRIKGKGWLIEFDGLLNFGDSDMIFEIKMSRSGIFPSSILQRNIDKLLAAVHEYQIRTKRNASLRIIMIGDFKQQTKQSIVSSIPEISPSSNIEVVVEFLTFEEIGIQIN